LTKSIFKKKDEQSYEIVKKEEKFVTELTIAISSIDTSKISNIKFLEAIHLLQGQIMYHENILKSL